jgi:glucan phosphorylase
VAVADAGPPERYQAVARSVRDVLSQRWIHTEKTYDRLDPKRVYYLSMEFLIGRSLSNNITNLLLDPHVAREVMEKEVDWVGILEQAPDAGLGNGGLGRLAACFLDSMAALQPLNALRVIVLYNRLRENPGLAVPPRTFVFTGKAAPAYHLAKLIIKLLNNVADTIERDPTVRGRIQVLFLPEYSVSMAERLIPGTDVPNQISTAGYEASGTSNMKFMMNGALTIGTRDGATIEMAEEAGEANLFPFGLSARQVTETRAWYNPGWHYEHERETRAALDLIFGGHFSREEPGVFAPLRDSLLVTDHCMHLADLGTYLEADGRLIPLHADPEAWAEKAILDVAASG